MKVVSFVRLIAIVAGASAIGSTTMLPIIRHFVVPGRTYSSATPGLAFFVMTYWQCGWLAIAGVFSGFCIPTRRPILTSLVLGGLAAIALEYPYLVYPKYRASFVPFLWPVTLAVVSAILMFHVGAFLQRLALRRSPGTEQGPNAAL